jgi:hypothetical protein
MPQHKLTRTTYFQMFAWALSLLASAIAIITWGQDHQWQLTSLSAYQVFPVLGLTAYSIMWTHYIVSIVRRRLGLEIGVTKRYSQITGYAVLALICLHPSILIYRLYRDGQGLPPSSYEHYVRPGLGWVTLLGTASLLIFLAYELRRFFGKRSWWKYVTYAGDAAMVAIFYHGLRLGTDLQHGWFMKLWMLYGVTLVGCLGYNYWERFSRKQLPQKKSA